MCADANVAEADREGLEVGLSLGSNLGDRLGHLRRARDAITGWDGFMLAVCSRVYETEPVDVAPEFRALSFLNAVIVVQSSLDVRDLNAGLHRLETTFGRTRTAAVPQVVCTGSRYSFQRSPCPRRCRSIYRSL